MISANWGLGESVVAGNVTPDVVVVDRVSGTLVSYQTGSKETMTVADSAGTKTVATSAGLRSAAVLSPARAGELARVGLAIEQLYDQPMDIEWALAAGELSVVQARPVTAVAGPGEQWNDSLGGDYLWSNGNLGEAIPAVMTPATWSFMELLMTRMTFPPSVPGYRGYGRIGGRFYANVSMAMALEALVGIPRRRFVTLFGPVVGKLPPVGEIPRARLPRWQATRKMVPATVAMLRKVNSDAKRLPGFVASAPGRCDQLRAEIAQVTEAGILPRLWQEQVRPLVVEACDMLAAATSHAGTTFVTSPRKLAKLVGEADASLLFSGQQTEDVPLASLGPVIGLARLARGEIDRDTFTRQYGHRSSQELELSALPRIQPPPCMYTMTGSMPVAPRGLIRRTRASPTWAGTVIHSSSTGSLLTGPDWASWRTLRASAGVMSYKNGGLENASATCWAAGSRTTGLVTVMTVLLTCRLGWTWSMVTGLRSPTASTVAAEASPSHP